MRDKALKVLENYVQDLGSRLESRQIEDVLRGDIVLRSEDLRVRPEAHVEDKLIWPLLEALELEVDKRPYGTGGGRGEWPDFKITNVGRESILGENKNHNRYPNAVKEIKDYLDRKSLASDFGIATDGIEWSLWKVESTGDTTDYHEIVHGDLRPVLLDFAHQLDLIGGLTEIDTREIVESFIENFSRTGLLHHLSDAPKRIREARKRGVEKFYDLYIELLFGEGKDVQYETNLLADIISPEGATQTDKRLFAVTLINRLLFIKILESRGIVPPEFLVKTLQAYERGSDRIPGTLYESAIRPLFYALLNTPLEDRLSKYRTSWFDKVPYLNGGLFRENVPHERDYNVRDRILPVIIRDLIEGSRLETDGHLDPSILGNVFEKTIIHLEHGREQKDVGAYYTPGDVTRLIMGQSVDLKIKDTLISVYAKHAATADAPTEIWTEEWGKLPLEEILRLIEECEGHWGRPQAHRDALDGLRNLRILDAACGSGHLLTSAMEEVYKSCLSILRGLHNREPNDKERYALKKELALKSVYGVDIEPAACEISKLRLWLKIIEGNGWRPEFGELPNIEANIVVGNSLVGFPLRKSTASLRAFTGEFEQIEELRRSYKRGEAATSELRSRQRRILSELNNHLLQALAVQQTHSISDSSELYEIFEEAADIGPNLRTHIDTLRIGRRNGGKFSEDDLKNLNRIPSVYVYQKSARINVRKTERELEGIYGEEAEKEFLKLLKSVLGSEDTSNPSGKAAGLVPVEIRRRALRLDLSRVQARAFHWKAEFPEVLRDRAGFDVLVGNPPYGDILTKSEKMLTGDYETLGFNEISAMFVERQLQLTAPTGYFSNVTTLGLVYRSDLGEFYDSLTDSLTKTLITCFGKRPMKVFEGAEVRVAIFSGQKGATDRASKGEIWTSEPIRFAEEDRAERMSQITYHPVGGLELTDSIGGMDGGYKVIPKVGNETIRGILDELKASSHNTIGDMMVEDENPHVIWKRRGTDYWITPMLEKLYSASEVKPMFFRTGLHRKAVFLTLSTSLFYLYWMVYGDTRHLNIGQIRRFPMLSDAKLNPKAEEIRSLADQLWEGMKKRFDSGLNQFDMSPLKPLVDEADRLIDPFYGLTETEIRFLQEYDGQYGRSAPTEADVQNDNLTDS